MIADLTIKIPAQKAYSYPIFIARDLLRDWRKWLPAVHSGKQIVIITDDIVASICAQKLADELKQSNYNVLLLIIKHGEASKSRANKEYLESQMLKQKFNRQVLCIALGGGVVGDLTGFIAATYMRGVKFLQMPTTLLSMLDSSIGGKTSVNTPEGKNLIGAFWQPQAVIMDINLLQSLPKEHLINGLIEAVKIFLTSDSKSFDYLNNNLQLMLKLDKVVLTSVIKRAVKLKAAIVRLDEKEANLRMILNFGHTIAHALEKLSNYKLLHGYAVATGIIVESKISLLLGYLSECQFGAICQLMNKLGINMQSLKNFDIDEIITASLGDKKNRDDQIYCVLLAAIGKVHLEGECFATKVDKKIIRMALERVQYL